MKKDFHPDWASEIKAIRKKLDLSQDEFAVKIGVASSTIGFWETGKVTPHKRTKQRILALCKTEPELVQGQGTTITAEQILPDRAGAPLDPALWEELQRIGRIFGRDPRKLLNEAVRFSIIKMAPQAEELMAAEEGKKKKKIS